MRSDKVTGDHAGIVTHEGIIKPGSMGLMRSGHEYGNIAFPCCMADRTIIPVIMGIHPPKRERIIMHVILRKIEPLPMKSIRYSCGETLLSSILKEIMSPDSISGMISSLPEDQIIGVM